jgi:beta-glucanase (GH16 family)
VFIDQGELVLQAKAEMLGQAQYTSGSVNTEGRRSYTYGRIAARILVPDGVGVGPAFGCCPKLPAPRSTFAMTPANAPAPSGLPGATS